MIHLLCSRGGSTSRRTHAKTVTADRSLRLLVARGVVIAVVLLLGSLVGIVRVKDKLGAKETKLSKPVNQYRGPRHQMALPNPTSKGTTSPLPNRLLTIPHLPPTPLHQTRTSLRLGLLSLRTPIHKQMVPTTTLPPLQTHSRKQTPVLGPYSFPCLTPPSIQPDRVA